MAENATTVQSLLRGLQILRQFTADSPELNVSELSKRTGLHRTTVYRLARTLETEGFLSLDTGSRMYSVGPAWASILQSLGAGFGLGKILGHELENLAQATKEEVALGVQSGSRIYILRHISSATVYLVRGPEEGYHTFRDTWNAGVKLHLAWSSPSVISRVFAQPIIRHTEHTISDPETLMDVLTQARAQQIAYELEEHKIGICAVAAPILVEGSLEASVGLIAITERFEKNKERYKTALMETAASMAVKLGEQRR